MCRQIVAARMHTGEAERGEIVHHRVVLASQRDRAEAVVRQPRKRLIAKLATALPSRSIHYAEAVLKLENRPCAAAEIFAPDETPVAAGHITAACLPGRMPVLIAGIQEPSIDHPIKRHARLCLRPAGVPRRAYGNNKSLLHLCAEVLI